MNHHDASGGNPEQSIQPLTKAHHTERKASPFNFNDVAWNPAASQAPPTAGKHTGVWSQEDIIRHQQTIIPMEVQDHNAHTAVVADRDPHEYKGIASLEKVYMGDEKYDRYVRKKDKKAADRLDKWAKQHAEAQIPEEKSGFHIPFFGKKKAQRQAAAFPRPFALPYYLEGGEEWHAGPNAHLTRLLEHLASLLKLDVEAVTDTIKMLTVFDYHRDISDIYRQPVIVRSRFSGRPLAEMMVYYSCHVILAGTKRVLPYPLVDVIELLSAQTCRRIDLIAANNQDESPAIALLGVYDYPPYGTQANLANHHPRDLVAMVIKFFRLLPIALIPATLKDGLRHFVIDPPFQLIGVNHAEAATMLLHMIPEPNFNIFAYITTWLHAVCEDRRSDMDLLTVSTIFGPLIFSCKGPKDMRESVRIYKWILFYWRDLERYIWNYKAPFCNLMPLRHRQARDREQEDLKRRKKAIELKHPDAQWPDDYYLQSIAKDQPGVLPKDPPHIVEDDEITLREEVTPPTAPVEDEEANQPEELRLPPPQPLALKPRDKQPTAPDKPANQSKTLKPPPLQPLAPKNKKVTMLDNPVKEIIEYSRQVSQASAGEGPDQLGELLAAQSKVFELEETLRQVMDGMARLENESLLMKRNNTAPTVEAAEADAIAEKKQAELQKYYQAEQFQTREQTAK